MDRPQPLWPDLSLDEKREKLRKTEENLWKLGKTNDEIAAVKTERAESQARLRKIRQDSRWRRSESPKDPSPEVSDLANSPPPGSSNESSVDVYTSAEHRRPDNIPPKVEKDEAQVVEDLSDREDEPSNGDGVGEDEVRERKVSESEDGSQREVRETIEQ